MACGPAGARVTHHLADLVNGSFEGIGAVCCWGNVRAYARERIVKGVYWPATLFFCVWGIWNCLYYPSLGQWFSTASGAVLTAGNIVWVTWVIWDIAHGRNVSGEPVSRG